MSDQLSLAGIDPSSRPTDRLFFAVFPDTATAAELTHRTRDWKVAHGLKGSPLATDRLHITLQLIDDFHGGLPPSVVAAAKQAAATLEAAPFRVVFDRVQSFRKPRNLPFVLLGSDDPSPLRDFQQRLVFALEQAGLRCARKSFTPHVTLLYDDRSVSEQPVEPVQWIVREFVLVHSLLGQTRHLPLARWPLQT